jgi:predicted nucleic acid-binding protein
VIVVDTSVWIDAHRRPTGRTGLVLNELLDADEVALALPVRCELLAGISRRDRRALVRSLSALPVLHPTAETWKLIEQWIPGAADKGRHFGLSDWLIAALATEVGARVWSLDEDFAALERLRFVQRYTSYI